MEERDQRKLPGSETEVKTQVPFHRKITHLDTRAALSGRYVQPALDGSKIHR